MQLQTAAMPAITIALLPFLNKSSDAENEYCSDGIIEEITNALAKIDGLKALLFSNLQAS